MNTDRCWKWIILKDGEYLMAAVNGKPRWSRNKSDAVQIDFFSDAIRIAEKVSGSVRRFNTVTREVK